MKRRNFLAAPLATLLPLSPKKADESPDLLSIDLCTLQVVLQTYAGQALYTQLGKLRKKHGRRWFCEKRFTHRQTSLLTGAVTPPDNLAGAVELIDRNIERFMVEIGLKLEQNAEVGLGHRSLNFKGPLKVELARLCEFPEFLHIGMTLKYRYTDPRPRPPRNGVDTRRDSW